MKLLTIAGLLIGMAALAVPVSADEQAWGESSRPSINQKLSDYKEMSRQNALEWQRKHVKQNWAQKLNGTYSTERVGESPQQQNNANQFMRRQTLSGQSSLPAPTLISPRGGGEYKPFGQGLNTNHFQPKQSKLGLNLGTSAGSSLHVDKQNLRKEVQSFGQGFGNNPGFGKGTAPGSGTGFGTGPGFLQNYGQEVDPTQ